VTTSLSRQRPFSYGPVEVPCACSTSMSVRAPCCSSGSAAPAPFSPGLLQWRSPSSPAWSRTWPYRPP
jgi:hypothetical protein